MHRTTSSAHGLDSQPLTSNTFAALARRSLHERPQPGTMAGSRHGPSDFDLNPGHERDFSPPKGYRPAAVLVPILARAEPQVLLTQRTATLSKHAGQIAFPGGTVDATDANPLATALREAEEEIGLPAASFELLGYLDSYRTGTGYVITPVVGLVEPNFDLVLNSSEVESTFEVPLGFLLDPANHAIDKRTIQGRERQFHAMPYQNRYIWGATAGIIRNMYERLLRL
jgi:8-oxo-dGTP pyrophosphatase MutT (NUDIX family)